MTGQERRGDVRFNCRLPMKYEILDSEQRRGITVATIMRDLSQIGVSFYSHELINLDSQVKISFYIASDKELSFLAQVKRVEKSWDQTLGEYIVGADTSAVDETVRQEIVAFKGRFDFSKVLSRIEMKGVMDIHFVGGYPPLIKRQDKIIPASSERLSYEEVHALLLNLLDDKQYKEFQEKREMNLIVSHNDLRFRANLHYQQNRIEGVFRVIPPKVKDLNLLGLPQIVENLLSYNRGLILVAGRTGSGKTTSLAAMVDFINNRREGIILCIEDPIEYVHTNKKCIIKQREVGKDTCSFFNACKNALRQSPDVLVIGEIRDLETMDIALSMAESGTLVMSSLHAPDTACALDRVVSLFPPDLQGHVLSRLSLTLLGIITQELIPVVDDFRSVLACEVLIVTDAVRQIIRQGDWKQIPTILQTGKAAGMQSREDAVKRLFEQGLIKSEYVKEYL